MTTINPTITNANPGPTLYAAIETVMLADGWTLVDTRVIGANTHKVLKSAAAGNARNLDWFLDINYPTTGAAGQMRFAPFEFYDPATGNATRGPFGHVSANTLDATTYSRYGATTNALETNWLNSGSASIVSMSLSTSTFMAWITVTRNRIIAQTNLSTTFYYSGFFIPNAQHIAHAGASLFPLIMVAIGPGGNSGSTTSIGTATAAVTRVPKAPAIAWNTSVAVYAHPAQTVMGVSGQAGVQLSDATGTIDVALLPVIFFTGSVPSTTISGSQAPAMVGTLDGLAAGYSSSTAGRGDTISDGTDTWMVGVPNGVGNLFMEMV